MRLFVSSIMFVVLLSGCSAIAASHRVGVDKRTMNASSGTSDACHVIRGQPVKCVDLGKPGREVVPRHPIVIPGCPVIRLSSGTVSSAPSGREASGQRPPSSACMRLYPTLPIVRPIDQTGGSGGKQSRLCRGAVPASRGSGRTVANGALQSPGCSPAIGRSTRGSAGKIGAPGHSG